MGIPTSSYTTTNIALQTIWPHKPHHSNKLEIPSGGINCIGCEKSVVIWVTILLAFFWRDKWKVWKKPVRRVGLQAQIWSWDILIRKQKCHPFAYDVHVWLKTP
jgi:hypothetical protein